MGGENSKLNYRKSVIQLTTKTEPVDPNDEEFWDQFWNEYETTVRDIFILMPAAEIRALREESPTNLSSLCTKAVQKIVALSKASCLTSKEQNTVLNCVRVLTRIMPYLFEDADWKSYFWNTRTRCNERCGEMGLDDGDGDGDGDGCGGSDNDGEAEILIPSLAEYLMDSCCDLLFFPDFTVYPLKKSGPDNPEDSQLINSCEYIWENGVGFSNSQGSNSSQDAHRCEILKLILTCFSCTMYSSVNSNENGWISYLTSRHNKHALPLFTSLLNVIFSYDPVGLGMPYNHLMFSDYREPLVEVSLQLLCVAMETSTDESGTSNNSQQRTPKAISITSIDSEFDGPENLFINFMSRIHKDNDFDFIVHGFLRLLNNPLTPTYLPNSIKKIQFHQELLILLWRMCEINNNFMFHLLKGDDLMDTLVPILYHMNLSCHDPAKLGIMHIGAFILLLLSGERNFGVKLNKVYTQKIQIDIPVFTGNHGDLLILVFHKIITSGHSGLQPLYDCFLTVIVNISPYLKSLCSSSASKLMHLAEAFSTPWFLYSAPANHHLIFFLLESLNNIVQYQFDGNSNLIYCMIRKRQVFHNLSSLRTDTVSISYSLSKKSRRLANITTRPQYQYKQSPYQSYHGSNTSSSIGSPTSPISNPDSNNISSIEISSNINSDSPDSSNHYKATLEETPALKYTIDKNEPHSDQSEIEQVTINKGEDVDNNEEWIPTSEWAQSWKQKLPLQTIMRLLQVLVPQVEKICIDKGLTDESEIIKFLQRGTLVGLLPVPHPLLIRKYQSNPGTDKWFRTYMWGVIYLRNEDPPIWYDTNIQLFEIQRVTSSN